MAGARSPTQGEEHIWPGRRSRWTRASGDDPLLRQEEVAQAGVDRGQVGNSQVALPPLRRQLKVRALFNRSNATTSIRSG